MTPECKVCRSQCFCSRSSRVVATSVDYFCKRHGEEAYLLDKMQNRLFLSKWEQRTYNVPEHHQPMSIGKLKSLHEG